ncbi:alpha-tocopherol transfer protein-like [Caerostris extrusa]|uniref:Alpha-tocopherol transfer protein-like n=1 Tax=Caerostris extrusa TaxID=172846 RepID=A0AAV4TLK2_CAEEX|nr:alpha-tocopherol transfer protein-like [Caerostris extrusa]
MVHSRHTQVPNIQNSIPKKVFELVNQSVTFKAAWFLVKPFLTDKLKKRIIFHSSPETLLDYFPKAVLPKQYGGDLENYGHVCLAKKSYGT